MPRYLDAVKNEKKRLFFWSWRYHGKKEWKKHMRGRRPSTKRWWTRADSRGRRPGTSLWRLAVGALQDSHCGEPLASLASLEWQEDRLLQTSVSKQRHLNVCGSDGQLTKFLVDAPLEDVVESSETSDEGGIHLMKELVQGQSCIEWIRRVIRAYPLRIKWYSFLCSVNDSSFYVYEKRIQHAIWHPLWLQ